MSDQKQLPDSMSIQQALSTMKLLEKRIQTVADAIAIKPMSIGTPAGFDNAEQYIKGIDSATDSLKQLLENRDKLRAAVTNANGRVKVKLVGQTMSVAIALNLKLGMELRLKCITGLKLNCTHIQAKYDRWLEEMEDDTETRVKSLLSADKTPSSAEYKTLFDAIREKNFKNLNKSDKLMSWLEKQEEAIDNFMTEIDYVLTESNVNTRLVLIKKEEEEEEVVHEVGPDTPTDDGHLPA